ncbi:MAG: ABC-type transport auxiliary lipoprotein family protein [Thermodesulfobacteriota bacterium]
MFWQAFRNLTWPALALLLALMLLPACLGGQAQPYVHQYLLDYPPPRLSDLAPLPAAVQVGRFSAAPELQSLNMFFAPQGQERDHYPYHRWLVNPDQLVSGVLLRDLVASGLFKAALGPGSLQQARFVMEGGVQSFAEEDQGSRAQASLELVITLLDTRQAELYRRVLFQRTYRAEQAMSAQSGPALAAAMSRAMAALSPRIIKDVHAAMQKRLAEGKPPLSKPAPQ